MTSIDEALMRRIRNDLIDSYDKELEMELEDRAFAELTGEDAPGHSAQDKSSPSSVFSRAVSAARRVG